MKQCSFDIAWVGKCKNYCLTDADSTCQEHAELVCSSCGKPATRQCDHTGQFVCGAPLCDDCSHSPPDKGSKNWFMMGGSHLPTAVANEQWEAFYADAR